MLVGPRPIVPRHSSDHCPSCGQSVEVCFGPICAKASGSSTAKNIATAAFACLAVYGAFRVGQRVFGAQPRL
jgi:hypothetical protein